MSAALSRVLPGVVLQACGVLKASWFRPLFLSAQRSQKSIGDVSTTESGSEFSLFPPMPGEPSTLRWGGKKYEDLPIVHIKAAYNNTHIQVTNSDFKSLVCSSCGREGFRNAKKTSSVAAQAVGIAAATKAINKGITHVRVIVKGMGPGRQHVLKALTMGGLEVVSITDNTPIPHNGCRPRKVRRL